MNILTLAAFRSAQAAALLSRYLKRRYINFHDEWMKYGCLKLDPGWTAVDYVLHKVDTDRTRGTVTWRHWKWWSGEESHPINEADGGQTAAIEDWVHSHFTFIWSNLLASPSSPSRIILFLGTLWVLWSDSHKHPYRNRWAELSPAWEVTVVDTLADSYTTTYSRIFLCSRLVGWNGCSKEVCQAWKLIPAPYYTSLAFDIHSEFIETWFLDT